MFKKLFSQKASKIDEPTSVVSDGLRKTILNSLGLQAVPMMPAAAQEAFRLATDPNAEALDFVQVLEADEGLSARILKIANSVFYDRGGGSRTIIEAVNVVGTSELRNLLNATILAGLFPAKHWLRAEFWGHNVGTAITARSVARSVLPSKSDRVFLAGLMHDVGKLLMLQQHGDNYARVVKQGLVEGIPAIEAEVQQYSFNHSQVGQMVAEKWKFSGELLDAIGSHHKPWKDLQSDSLTAIVKLSDLISHAESYGTTKDAATYKRIHAPLLEEAWEYFGISAKDQKRIIQEVTLDINEEFQTYETWGKM
jgi:putative nucleotidyltransferase with HDIG domain